MNSAPTHPDRALQPLTITPIGWVRGGRAETTKDGWGGNRSRLELDASRFSPDSLLGLEALSHIEVVFYFHVDEGEPTETGARHPRGRTDWPRTGIFAQRGRMRPNRLGVSICRVVNLDLPGLAIEVEGLDAVDGTPLIDIKPVWSGYQPRGDLREPVWAQELMAGYW